MSMIDHMIRALNNLKRHLENFPRFEMIVWLFRINWLGWIMEMLGDKIRTILKAFIDFIKSVFTRLKTFIHDHVTGCIVLAIMVILFVANTIFGIPWSSNESKDQWASFLGSFLGGVATLIAVVITIKHEEELRKKERVEKEEEQKKLQRTLIEVRIHDGSIEALEGQYVDKMKILYPCMGGTMPSRQKRSLFLQIMNRSGYRVKSVDVLINTRDYNEAFHSYTVNIPYVDNEELSFVVLPQGLVSLSGARGLVEMIEPGTQRPNEVIDSMKIEYLTSWGEHVTLRINGDFENIDRVKHVYSIDEEIVFTFELDNRISFLFPKQNQTIEHAPQTADNTL